ncbi:MAG: flagellar brake domain-containing protein [Synergistaceae bacterium]|jgi:c-di-GMP-binding flagellar brake protein YcgR|nr:flagellar brake domain-containing protein [Synergistaceae bacterium]
MSSPFDQTRRLLSGLVGAKVTLSSDRGANAGSYSTRLEAIGDDEVAVARLAEKGRFVPVHAGMDMTMRIEGSGCFYEAAVMVSRLSMGDTVPLMWVRFASVLERIQRRMFVRVPCSVDARCFYLDYDGPAADARTIYPEREWFPIHVTDMSLGGIGASINKSVGSYCIIGGRYLLLLYVGEASFFLVGKLVKMFERNVKSVEMGVAFNSGISAFTEKLMTDFIRKQEFTNR